MERAALVGAAGEGQRSSGTRTAGVEANRSQESHREPGAALRFTQVFKTFLRPTSPPLEVLANVDLTIEPKRFVSIVGRSGCGKTTLLRIASRTLQPTSGSVAVGGSERFAPGKDVAMVYQSYGLFPWQTVGRNVALGPRVQGYSHPQAQAQPFLERVGLAAFADFYPHELSGGMQQRVGLARALAVQPRVLLMDEPFAAVDALSREQLHDMLLAIWYAEPLTVLFVTHDIAEAIFLSDRIVVMGNAGAILADVPVSLPRPRTAVLRTSPEFIEIERRVRGALN